MTGTMKVSPDTQAMINARIGQIDKLISDQLNAVLHNPDFQKLEASWRGLHYFVHQSETSTQLKIRVLNATKQDLQKDLERASEFDQSASSRRSTKKSSGPSAAAPFGALVGDFEFSRNPEDVAMLEKLSNVAAAAHAPALDGGQPPVVQLGRIHRDGWTSRPQPRFSRQMTTSSGGAFRESEDCALPGTLRPPHLDAAPLRPRQRARRGIQLPGGCRRYRPLEVSLGQCRLRVRDPVDRVLCQASLVRGDPRGGRWRPRRGFAVAHVQDRPGRRALKCPTEIAITDRREKELSDLGFIPLVHCKNTDFAAFFGARIGQGEAVQHRRRQRQRPARHPASLYLVDGSVCPLHEGDDARQGRQLHEPGATPSGSSTPGSPTMSTPDDNASADTKAQYPLRDARIEVVDVAGKPGCYKAVAFLKPHFQLDELTVSLRLVAELPPPAQGG